MSSCFAWEDWNTVSSTANCLCFSAQHAWKESANQWEIWTLNNFLILIPDGSEGAMELIDPCIPNESSVYRKLHFKRVYMQNEK